MADYLKEFPDFVMDVALPDGLEDQSWHNEVCPSFFDPVAKLRIWIDYADVERREYPNLKRFGVEHWDGTDNDYPLGEDTRWLLWTDDWNEVVALITEKRAAA